MSFILSTVAKRIKTSPGSASLHFSSLIRVTKRPLSPWLTVWGSFQECVYERKSPSENCTSCIFDPWRSHSLFTHQLFSVNNALMIASVCKLYNIFFALAPPLRPSLQYFIAIGSLRLSDIVEEATTRNMGSTEGVREINPFVHPKSAEANARKNFDSIWKGD